MKGILDAASEITGQMVEPGIPRGFTSGSKLVNTPEMATAVGLVKHGSMLMRRTAADRENGDYRSMISRFRDFLINSSEECNHGSSIRLRKLERTLTETSV